MQTHDRAKLGPAWPVRADRGDRERNDAEGGGRRLMRGAGHSPPLVAPPTGGKRRGTALRELAV